MSRVLDAFSCCISEYYFQAFSYKTGFKKKSIKRLSWNFLRGRAPVVPPPGSATGYHGHDGMREPLGLYIFKGPLAGPGYLGRKELHASGSGCTVRAHKVLRPLQLIILNPPLVLHDKPKSNQSLNLPANQKPNSRSSYSYTGTNKMAFVCLPLHNNVQTNSQKKLNNILIMSINFKICNRPVFILWFRCI